MDCNNLEATIAPEFLDKYLAFEPLKHVITVIGCDSFTPDCYWFVNGDLVAKGLEFNYVFYKPGKYTINSTVICGSCTTEYEYKMIVEENKNKLNYSE